MHLKHNVKGILYAIALLSPKEVLDKRKVAHTASVTSKGSYVFRLFRDLKH